MLHGLLDHFISHYGPTNGSSGFRSSVSLTPAVNLIPNQLEALPPLPTPSRHPSHPHAKTTSFIFSANPMDAPNTDVFECNKSPMPTGIEITDAFAMARSELERQKNNVIQNNDQITGANNKIITDKIEYSNSLVTYKISDGNSIDIENQISDIKSLELTLKFNQENQSLLFHGKVMPYNLRIGRAMSYHE